MTTTLCLTPCACGSQPQTRHFPVSLIRSPSCYWVTCNKHTCNASTPDCADVATAIRAWNAMQQAVLGAKEKSNVEK